MRKNKTKKSLTLKTVMLYIFLMALAAVALLFLAAMIVCLFSGEQFSVKTYFAAFTNKNFWTWYVVLIICGIGVIVVNYRISAKKEVMKENDGEESKLLTLSDMHKSIDFDVVKLSKIHTHNDGIVLMAERKGNDVQVVMSGKPQHVQVLGTTGSGKTTGFINPTVQVLAHTKTKPSMIITDPKGELYNAHAARMLGLGYKVHVIDLAEPYRSTKWNPFEILKERIDKIVQLSYSEDGNVSDNDKVEIQVLRDELFELAKDLTEAICPIDKSNDLTWQKGARSLINAIVLAMCEDYESEEITEEQFCFVTLYHIVTDHANEESDVLKSYLYDSRSEISKVKGLAKRVLETQEKTLTSFLSDVNGYAEWLTDTGVLSLTSANEIDFYSFDVTPTVLFIKIPDEKKTRHRLVTLLITQMYKSFVEKARRNCKSGATEELELIRTVYFLLDEFGNLPAFQDLSTMITVARSRKIFFEMIIQSYAQMVDKYGREIAQAVKDNCNIKIFLGATDQATLNEISDKIGKKKVSSLSVTSTLEKSASSSSTGSTQVPIMYPNELAQINSGDDFGNAIVLPFGHFAFKSKYTPSWECQDIYRLGKSSLEQPQVKFFNEKKHIYDITLKTDKILEIRKEQEQLKKLMVTQANESHNRISKRYSIVREISALTGLIDENILKELRTQNNKDRLVTIENLLNGENNQSIKFKLIALKNSIIKETKNDNNKE